MNNKTYELLPIAERKEYTRSTVSKNGKQDLSQLNEAIRDKFFTNILIYHFMGVHLLESPVGTIRSLEWNQQYPQQRKDGEEPVEITLVSNEYVVQANTRKFQTTLSRELIEDLSSTHDIDSVSDVVTQELMCEFHTLMCAVLYKNSRDSDTVRIDTDDDPKVNIQKLRQASTSVARRTGRGVGNKWILPVDLYFNILPELLDLNFKQQKESIDDDLIFVGTAMNNTEIFVSQRNTIVLIVYKGISETDAGMHFSPYQFGVSDMVDTCGYLLRSCIQPIGNAIDYCINIQVR